MRITCPFCGERDSGEFVIAGDAGVRRPRIDAPEAEDSQTRFVEAVYVRDNPAGRHAELWYHAMGCRSWLQVSRDTRTHEIFAATLVKEARGR